MDLKSTLNLPNPDLTIPMKADLPHREPQTQQQWDSMRIYHRLLESRKDAPTFVLHDGPPYTNGPVHIGTALNKILKDFVVKSRAMLGFRTPYVPGYDNHGLPIEQTVLRELQAKGIRPDIVTLRRACREHAARYIDVQTRQFQRLGVFGLWEQPYKTMDFRYEAEIIRCFKRLAELGYVYRGLRPTLWSPSSRTALADTEIVYRNHVSKAITVRFPLLEDANGWAEGLKNVYAVIWTTTPWTIPANLAVAFHPATEYSIVQVGEDHYVVARALASKLAADLGWEGAKEVRVVLGSSFEGSSFKHPIFDRPSVAVLADYVTTDEGTGVVHTAPGHGREDFQTGMKYGLDILCPVDEAGVLTAEAGEFAGVSYKDCDRVVVERLAERGNLLKVTDYAHSYPHAERDDKPVIFRTTEQWFIGMDSNDLRSRMLEEIERVQWLPPSGKARIQAMVANRPDWCISRQRPWGVGVPVVYGAESGIPVLQPEAIEAIAQLVEREGSDAWFEQDPSQFLPEGFQHPQTGETTFRKETDVLDVWFDSGCTNICVLEGNVNPAWKEHWPADVYLEGSDQHRGWFNTSLIVATAIRGEAPYRTVITHGFVTDEQGKKMSKRLGNVVDPDEACQKFGADVLRYWVASVKWEDDVPCSDNLLQRFGEDYRRIRNTLRFLLGNLSAQVPNEPAELWDLDAWLIGQIDLLTSDCVAAYERFDFGAALGAIHHFCVRELSSFYLDAIKDRMYCDGKEWPSRKSGSYACRVALVQLTKLIAPILPHTAEEVWQKIPWEGDPSSVHLQRFGVPTADRLQEIEANDRQIRFAALLELRDWVFSEFERWKESQPVKDSQDVLAELTVSPAEAEMLASFGPDLHNLMKFSWVNVSAGEQGVRFSPSPYEKCVRSRVRRPDVRLRGDLLLCDRCAKVLEELGALA